MVFHSDEDLNYRGFELDELSIIYKPINECGLGDINLDGLITINDIVKAIDFIVIGMIPIGIEKCISDLNEDEIINVVDIIAIINIILEVEN